MSLSAEWRKECMVNAGIEFLNAGTLAPTLRSAFQAVCDTQLKWMTDGPGGSLEIPSARAYLNMMEEQDKCRRIVAEWLGATPSSVALLGNVTDGINAALGSIPWQAGDRIVTSDEEHDALHQPLQQLQRRFGVEVDVVRFPKSSAEVPDFVASFAANLSPGTKLVALSQVSHRSGVRVDVGAVIAALETRPDIWLLIDGAHAAGTSTDLILPRIDFYVFPGHKWLFGLVETGVLWVSERVLKETTPLMSGSPMMSAEGVRYEDGSGAWRYEYGTRDWSKMVGLSVAIQFRQQWPEEVLIAHYRALGAGFSEGVERKSELQLHGEAPVVSFETTKSNRIANALWEEHRVLVKPQETNIRVSLAPWIDPERSHQLGELIGRTVAELRH